MECVKPGGMSITWYAFARYAILFDRAALNASHPDQAFSLDHEKLLCLGVVVMVSSRSAGLGSGDEDLSKVWLLDEFRQAAAGVRSGSQAVPQLRRRNIRQIGCIQSAVEPLGKVRQRERGPHLMKCLDSSRQVAQLNPVARDLHGRLLSRLPSFDLCQKGRNHIVHIAQLQFARGIGDGNWQVMRNVVAKGCGDRVVVGAAPLSEQIFQPVDADRGTGLRGKLQQRLLRLRLAHPVWIVELGLDRRTENDLWNTLAFAQEPA